MGGRALQFQNPYLVPEVPDFSPSLAPEGGPINQPELLRVVCRNRGTRSLVYPDVQIVDSTVGIDENMKEAVSLCERHSIGVIPAG